MKPVVLFRVGYDDPNEPAIAAEHFPVVTQRCAVPPGALVIGRYSVIPFYKELEQDVTILGSTLVNSYRQHRYIADLGNWYRDLAGITPETWNALAAVPDDAWPCVIKGETNSKKWQWSRSMFAKDRDAAINVMARLSEDSTICDQSLYLRRFVPLRGVNVAQVGSGPPISHEFRFFACDGQVLCGAFYWACFDREEIDPYPSVDSVPKAFLTEVIERIGKNARFYVVDVAQTVAGDWIVIELNDGQQSGLSDNDPRDLYSNLQRVLAEDKWT